MIEKVIEVYELLDGNLNLGRPAFDILFDSNGRISGKPLAAEWNGLETRIVFDLMERLRPAPSLDLKTELRIHQFGLQTAHVKLPLIIKNSLEPSNPEPRTPISFEDALLWLEKELLSYNLGLRIASPGG